MFGASEKFGGSAVEIPTLAALEFGLFLHFFMRQGWGSRQISSKAVPSRVDPSG
jgi:hypothetical protein